MFRIEHRFNKHGRIHDWFDVIDDTGDCVKTFGHADKEVAKQQARDWVAAQTPMH